MSDSKHLYRVDIVIYKARQHVRLTVYPHHTFMCIKK